VYRALDIFFFIFHSSLILFILLGWIPRKTRRLHLATVILTAFCWFVLGIRYGFGYCPCTDWHWRVRWQLGQTDMPNSYIKFLIDSFTGWNANATLVDGITVAAFFLACILAVYVNWPDREKKQRPGPRLEP
jgi:hypothetical protein